MHLAVQSDHDKEISTALNQLFSCTFGDLVVDDNVESDFTLVSFELALYSCASFVFLYLYFQSFVSFMFGSVHTYSFNVDLLGELVYVSNMKQIKLMIYENMGIKFQKLGCLEYFRIFEKSS